MSIIVASITIRTQNNYQIENGENDEKEATTFREEPTQKYIVRLKCRLKCRFLGKF